MVLVDSVPDFVTSDDPEVATIVDGNIVVGESAGTATISAWMDGSKVDSEKITVSTSNPYAVSVEFTETVLDDSNDYDLDKIVTVTDQYDVEINTTLYFSVSDSDYSVGSGNKLSGPSGDVEVTVVTSNGLTTSEVITVD